MASQTSEPSTIRVSDEIAGSVEAFAEAKGNSASEVRELIARWATITPSSPPKPAALRDQTPDW